MKKDTRKFYYTTKKVYYTTKKNHSKKEIAKDNKDAEFQALENEFRNGC